MTKSPTHPAIIAFLAALVANGKASTARTYGHYFLLFERWLAANRLDLLHATTDQLAAYQLWLSKDRSLRLGNVRALSTQATAVITVKTLYAWLHARGHIVHDPAVPLVRRSTPKTLTVRKDHLTLQEATALIQTQAAMIDDHPTDSSPRYRALQIRNLAMLSLALATGRRVRGLVTICQDQIDLERNEVRVEREKGRMGRVLPVAEWAMAAVRRYIAKARPLLVRSAESPWLFLSITGKMLDPHDVGNILHEAVSETTKRNPDLTDLPNKRISTHSLRVSFATLLFQGGCNIRSINEMMLHQTLTTTARYTPIPISDLRHILLSAHPRA
jgi:site-specific recombinase XerD